MKRIVAAAAITAGALLGAPAASAEIVGFTSPSGNIGCILGEGSVRCDISTRDWAPPARPADCPGITGFGQGITVASTGPATFVCAGDTTLASGPPLAYGQSQAGGGVSCASEPAGMRCSNSDGHGFTLSRQGYQLF